MLTVIGGLAGNAGFVSTSRSDSGGQRCAVRAIDSRAERDVHGDDYRFQLWHLLAVLTDTLPAGFEYVSSDDGGEQNGQGGRLPPD